MISWISGWLAQATTQPSGPAPPQAPMFNNLFFGLMLAFVVFWIFLQRGQSKRQKDADKMIQALKKNDRVVTIGGIVGTVVSTRDDEVVLRVDESSNTKMTFVRKGIQRVLTQEDKS